MLLPRKASIAGSGCLLAAALQAQGVVTGELSGVVRDAAGAPLAGALVAFASPALQGRRELGTDAAGRFFAPHLPPGVYRLQVRAAGFQTLEARQRLGLGEPIALRFTLQPVGGATVAVSAAPARMAEAAQETAANFLMDRIEDLPLERTPEAMLVLTPGVLDSSRGWAPTPSGAESVRGAMTYNNRYLLDGQVISDQLSGLRAVQLIDDAIEEIQVLTGALPADYGDVDGGVINTLTRSGGNTFTGTLRVEAQNPSWNALTPCEDRSALPDRLNTDLRLSVGGYLVKDRLWFFLSGYRKDQDTPNQIDAGVFAGTPFTTTTQARQMQAKLTCQAAQDQTFIFSCVTNRQDVVDPWSANADLAALTRNRTVAGSWSLGWLAAWTPRVAMEARVGGLQTHGQSGGVQPGVTPVVDLALGETYGNGQGNWFDGGDHRWNTSADLKVTTILEAGGRHELSLGSNLLQEAWQAQGQLSPTDDLVAVFGYDPRNPAAVTTAPYLWVAAYPTVARVRVDKAGLFANDRWTLDDRFALNLGLRRDAYAALAEDTGIRNGAHTWSPRLGLTFDPARDGRWRLTASFCRYNANPIQWAVNYATGVGGPAQVYYAWSGPADANGQVSQADLMDFAHNWAPNPVAYASPQTRSLDPGLHPPHTDEAQVSAARAFRAGDREAHLKLTLVRRDYKDLFDTRIGNDGTVLPPAPFTGLGPQFVSVMDNDGLAWRVYKGAELEGAFQGGGFDAAANVTWSSLEGNAQAEGAPNAGLQTFSVVDGKQEYDPATFNPSGKLIGDVPIRIRAALGWRRDTAWGRTSLGVLYRFTSGTHLSATRPIQNWMVSPDFAALPATQTVNWVQFYDNQLGTSILNASAFTDVSVKQEVDLPGPVRFFAKLTVQNVFNHQQYLNWYVGGEPAVNGLSDPWVWTQYPKVSSNFGPARTLLAEAGVRF